MAVNFSEQLQKLRRQTAATSGRQPTREEVAGVAEGVAESAGARLARSRGLELQEQQLETQETLENKRLDQQQKQFAEQQAEQKRVTDLEFHAGKAAEVRQERAQTSQSVAAGATIGAFAAKGTAVGGPVGAVVGAVVGLVASSGSWVCEAVEKEAGLTISEVKTLLKFRKYALENHKAKTEYYLEVGPRLVAEMIKNGASTMLYDLKGELIFPVVRLFNSCQPEKAYKLYKYKILELMVMYKPELLKGVPHGE